MSAGCDTPFVDCSENVSHKIGDRARRVKSEQLLARRGAWSPGTLPLLEVSCLGEVGHSLCNSKGRPPPGRLPA